MDKTVFGQMIMLGLDRDTINDEIISLIRAYKIGGVVLYQRNYHDVKSMIEFINGLKLLNSDNIPLFISIDQENGLVNRLPLDIDLMPSPRRQIQDIDMLNKINEITADILKSVGVNMNYAPVLDTLHYEGDNITKKRSYGDDASSVIKYGIPFMKTLNDKGIISVIKHFPGNGLVRFDTHYILPTIKDKKLLEEDVIPFKEAINNGAEALMVGHLRIKGCGLKPASMSKKIIKKYLGSYDGLLVKDDILMNVMRYMFGIKNIFRSSINAGMNIIMVKYKPGLTKTIDKLLRSSFLNKNKINSSYKKIINIKKKYNINNDLIDNNINVDEINIRIKEAIKE